MLIRNPKPSLSPRYVICWRLQDLRQLRRALFTFGLQLRKQRSCFTFDSTLYCSKEISEPLRSRLQSSKFFLSSFSARRLKFLFQIIVAIFIYLLNLCDISSYARFEVSKARFSCVKSCSLQHIVYLRLSLGFGLQISIVLIYLVVVRENLLGSLTGGDLDKLNRLGLLVRQLLSCETAFFVPARQSEVPM